VTDLYAGSDPPDPAVTRGPGTGTLHSSQVVP